MILEWKEYTYAKKNVTEIQNELLVYNVFFEKADVFTRA